MLDVIDAVCGLSFFSFSFFCKNDFVTAVVVVVVVMVTWSGSDSGANRQQEAGSGCMLYNLQWLG